MIVVFIGISWLAGIALAATIGLDLSTWSIAAFLSLAAAVGFYRRDPRTALALACLCAFAAGAARAVVAQPVLDAGHIAQYNDTPRAVTITGTVVEPPDIRDRSINLRVAVDEITLHDGDSAETEGIVLVTTFRFPVIEYGSTVRVRGNLQTPPEEYDFSYKEFLAREGIHSIMFLPAVDVLATEQGNPLLHALLAFKASAHAVIDDLLPSPQSAMLQAVLLGDDSGLPDPVVENFRTVGLAHLLVVSGFHVAVLTLVVVRFSEPLLGRRGAVWFTIVILLCYMMLVGAGPSVVRATIMGIAYLIGSRLLGRAQFGPATLLAAAMIMTAVNPLMLWSVGFQLSFAATLGLILYARPLDGWARRVLLQPVPERVADGPLGLIVRVLVASLAAQILTIPLMMYYFQQVSLVSLLANVLVMPVQPLVLMLGGAATLLGLVFLPLGQVVAWADWLFLTYTLWVAELLAVVPWASVSVRISLPALALLYAIIGGISWVLLQEMERRERIFGRIRTNFGAKAGVAGGAVATVLVLLWGVQQPDGLLHVRFLDVGQGDATLVVTPSGRQILIDGGYFPTLTNSYLGRHLPFWDNTLDIVIATHPDADHVSGLPGVFDRYAVDRLVTYGATYGESAIYDALLESAEAHDVPQHTVRAGDVIVVEDGVRLEIVHPGPDLGDSRNDNSVGVRLTYGAFSALLTGDAEEKAERAMLERALPLQAQIFKAGHHGSRGSSTLPLLEQVRPQIMVISAGDGNNFGHPHQEVLDRATQVGAAVLRTDELGSIAVTTDGEQMWWEAEN